MKSTTNTISKSQRGAALPVALILLVVLLMSVLVGSQSAVIQQRLTGNFRDSSIAFQAAESAARWSAAWLQSRGHSALSRPFPCSASCDSTSRVWAVGNYPADPAPTDALWSSARTYGTDPTDDSSLSMTVAGVHSQPRFIMEQQRFLRDDLAGDPQKGVAFYRITSKGIGSRSQSEVVVTAVLAKRFE
jgi:type IV pilus assembly protein PilX